ncbi:hypothetical protein [Polaribacter sp.]|uniref:hypothetical protein n=1 Tax=Polaribacter sp. TaxID=1920175 RepID=UPI0040477E0B
MKIFKLILFILFISCDFIKSSPECLEFENYPNTDRVTETKSMYKYYFIKNAPDNNEELRVYTDKLTFELMDYVLNDSVNSVTFFFFTDKPGFLWGIVDENYSSEGPTVEDHNNPRRAEYTFSINEEKEVWLSTTIYKNERTVLPSIVYSKRKLINKIK